MEKVFDKRYNIEKILKQLKCDKDKDNYILYNSTLSDVIAKDLENIDSIAYYTYGATNKFAHENCEKCIYCIVTLGEYVDIKVKEYFDTGEYLEGMILSSLSDDILNNLADDLNAFLKSELEDGKFLTKRMECGNSVPLDFQKTIFKRISSVNNTNISLTSGLMLKPSKSMGYFYGISDVDYSEGLDHDCDECPNISCSDRQVNITLFEKNSSTPTIIQCEKGANLLEVFRENDIKITATCAGYGFCKKCGVDIVLDEKKETSLACKYSVFESINVFYTKIDDFEILSDFKIFPYETNKYKIYDIKSKKFQVGDTINEYLEETLSKNLEINIKSLKKLSDFEEYNRPFKAVIKDDNLVVDIPNDDIAYGIGIDIGTTTIAISLVNLLTGEHIKCYKTKNNQKEYGADVISRTEFSKRDSKNVLTSLVVNDIITGIDNLLEKLSNKNICEIVIAGNTTMIYLLLGLSPISISVNPFTLLTNKKITLESSALFKKYDCIITILPSISAYIGGDITSGIFAADMANSDETILFLDIGTNGEMGLLSNKKLITASTAAGPVFEGANISCGTPSIAGAMVNLRISSGKFFYDTIGNAPPIGICGSGAIDILASLIDNKLIDSYGLLEDGEKVQIKDEIVFTQKDIRQMQLAKSAIIAGILTMIKKANICEDDIDKVYLAGGFGSNISISNSVKIGLIPRKLESKVEVIGNSSLAGAIKFLSVKDATSEFEKINSICTHLELANENFFNQEYINNLNFQI